MPSRHVPLAVRQQLREEGNFGCAYCGTPLIQYHHIVPFSEERHHDPAHMIALCPTCHAEADAKTIKRKKLYELKDSPAISDKIEHKFYFESEERTLVLGNVGVMIDEEQEGMSPVLSISGKNLLHVGYSNGILQFNVEFYSRGKCIATVTNNEWQAEVEDIWDIRYKKKYLTIQCSREDVGLSVKYYPESDEIFVVGKLNYNNDTMLIKRTNQVG